MSQCLPVKHMPLHVLKYLKCVSYHQTYGFLILTICVCGCLWVPLTPKIINREILSGYIWIYGYATIGYEWSKETSHYYFRGTSISNPFGSDSDFNPWADGWTTTGFPSQNTGQQWVTKMIMIYFPSSSKEHVRRLLSIFDVINKGFPDSSEFHEFPKTPSSLWMSTAGMVVGYKSKHIKILAPRN